MPESNWDIDGEIILTCKICKCRILYHTSSIPSLKGFTETEVQEYKKNHRKICFQTNNSQNTYDYDACET